MICLCSFCWTEIDQFITPWRYLVSKTITRIDMVNALHAEVGLARSDCASLLETVLNHITDSLAGGEQVKISNFATFSVRQKKERRGRNPKTGVEVPVSARKSAPIFNIGENVKLSPKEDVNLNASVVRSYSNGFAVEFSDTENVVDLLNRIASEKDY